MPKESENKPLDFTNLLGDIKREATERAGGAEKRIHDAVYPSRAIEESSAGRQSDTVRETEDSSYYDFDLAEFPWAAFSRSDRPKNNGPIIYEDTIKHPETGEDISRRFETHPSGQFGHATATTYELAYILIQIYIKEHGCKGDKIHFKSLKHLARERGLSYTGPNLEKIRRDLTILSTMSINSYNAFWDSERKAYANMVGWSFFGHATYFMPTQRFMQQEELPLGFIEVTPVFQKIAATRGLFGLGFPPEFFFSLKPLEQRLAVYLARRFKFQSFVTHQVDKVCAAIPINAAREDNRRKKLREVAQGLIDKQFPLLANFTVEKSKREWKVTFTRKRKPTPEKPIWSAKDLGIRPEEQYVIDEIVSLIGDDSSRAWFVQCLRAIGDGPMNRAIGNFKELYVQEKQPIKTTPGAVMTGIIQGIAEEMGIQIRKH